MSYTINTRSQFGQPLVTYSGLSSGVNTQAIVDAETAAASKNQTIYDGKAAIQATKAGYYASIATQLGALDSVVSGLQYAGLFAPSSATTSDASKIAISNYNVAQTGTYLVNVTQLAQGQINSSTNFSNGNSTVISDPPAATLTNPNPQGPSSGSINIAVGGGTATTFALTRTTTLSQLANSINNSGIAVSATLVTDSKGTRINLASKGTGTNSALTITETNSKVNFNNSLIQAAKNAVGTVNNAPFEIQSNQSNSLIMGLTMSFAALTGSPVTVTVYKDAANLGATVQAFVINYNAVRAAINAATQYGPTTSQNNLLSDSGVQNALGSLVNAVTSRPNSATGTYSTLAEIGVSQNADGTLGIDTAALTKAIATDASSVANLFGDTSTGTGVASKLDAITTTYGGPAGVFMKMSMATQGIAGDNAQASQDMQYGIDARAATMQSNFVTYELNMAALAAQNMLVESYTNAINAANASSNQTPTAIATDADAAASAEAAAAKAIAASLTTGGGLNGFVPPPAST